MSETTYRSPDEFEKFVQDNILGRTFPKSSPNDGDIGLVVEKLCFGNKLSNKQKDIQFEEDYPDYEIKVMNKKGSNLIHISSLTKNKYSKVQAIEYSLEKVQNIYIIIGESCEYESFNSDTNETVMIPGWKYTEFSEYTDLNEGLMRESFNTRSSQGDTRHSTSVSYPQFFAAFNTKYDITLDKNPN